jgi:hypothetical protein
VTRWTEVHWTGHCLQHSIVKALEATPPKPRPVKRAFAGLELCAVKVCAVSRTERIATRGGRSSGQMTPRRTTNLDPKGRGDKSMSVKRRTTEDVYVVALQRLSDMVKAILPEPVRHVTAKLNRVRRTP